MSEWIRSYSQCGEDILLWRVLKDVSEGFYIDIGAFDPNVDSVTRIFYEAGWSGINIEPSPVMLERFAKERPRDINLGIAASDRDAEMELNLVGETGLTTLVGEVAEMHRRDGMAVEQIKVRTRPLADIWDDHVPKGKEVHFLKIDVEGAEEAVIRGADWSQHRPWILVVEAVEPNSTIESHRDWDPLLQEAGYVFVNFDGLNRYYVASERRELIEPLRAPLNFITDKYWPAAVHHAQDEAARLREMAESIPEIKQELSSLLDFMQRRPRPLWEKAIFRRSGKPKKLFRRILFHNSGKPRGIFRKWVLLPNGHPRAAFQMWMCSADYQNLPSAVRVNGRRNSLVHSHHKIIYPKELSPRGEEMKSWLVEAVKKSAEK